MDKWIQKIGQNFLIDIGLQTNHIVLDFGCGHGTYTLPASIVVGEYGKIYAIDKNKESLDKLEQKASELKLHNIKCLEHSTYETLPLSDKYVDVILLYDVIHLIEKRKQLLLELYRILKPYGILSVYPKHHQKDMNMDLQQITKEIEQSNFQCIEQPFKTLMHDDQLEKGYVLNFKKKTKKCLWQ